MSFRQPQITLIESVIDEFGQSMGIARMQFDADGLIKLTFERYGDLFIERLPERDSVLIYLAFTVEYPDNKLYQKALELCHPRERHPFAVNPGLRGEDRFIFSVRFKENDLTRQHLEQAVDLLQTLCRKLQS